MADILLSFGLQHDAKLDDSLQSQLTTAINALEKSAPKIQIGVELKKSSLDTFKSQLTKIVNSVTTGTGKSITLKIDGLGNITADAEKAADAVKKVGNAAKDAANDVKGVGAAADVAENKISKAFQIKTLDQLDKRVKKLKKNLKDWSAASKDAGSARYYDDLNKALEKYLNLISQIENAKLFGENEIYNPKHESDIVSEMLDIDEKVSIAARGIDRADKATKSWSDRVGTLAEKFSTWLSISQVIMQIYNALRQMVTIAVEVDTAMTELKKVTNETDATYDQFLTNASVRAKNLGATLTDVIDATASFARLGNDIERSSALADAAIVYKNVGDGIESIDQASESIVSTMQAFEGLRDSDPMQIVDKMNEVGNNFAISSTGIGEALQRSASALNAANNTLDESIALAAAANTIIQNPESVGTTLKTISMFLRSSKTDAEEAGISTEGMVESTSKLRKEILALTGEKVDIQLDEDTFKSTYQILKELSGVWDTLTDVSQANILEKIGGKRNANVTSALIENFSIAEEALATSLNSAGSALAENEKYLNSIQGHISRFQSSFQVLSETAINSDFAKDVIDLGTGFLDAANAVFTLIDAVGGLEAVLSAIVAYKSINFFGDIIDGKTKITDIVKGVNSLINIIPGLKDFDISQPFIKGSKAFGVWDKMFQSAFNKNRAQGVSVVASYVNALGDSFSQLKSTISPAKLAMTKFALGVSAVVAAYNMYKQWEQNRKDAFTEDINTYNQQTASIENYKNEINSLKASLDSGTLSHEGAYNVRSRLLEIQGELIDNYGTEASALNILTASADEATAALDGLNAASAQKYLTENAGIINAATMRMEMGNNIETITTNLGGSSDALQDIKDIVSDFDNISVGGDAINGYFLRVTGDANEARESILAIKPELEKLEKVYALQETDIGLDRWIYSLDSAYNQIQSYVADYEKYYNESIKMKIASGSDYTNTGELKTYHSVMQEITDAQLEFSKATESSYDSVEERAEAYASGIAAMEGAYNTLDSIKWSDESVKEEFYGQLDEWQDTINEKKLFIDVVARFDGDASTVDSGQFDGILDEAEKVINSGVLDNLKGEDGLIDAYQILNESLDVEAAGEFTDGLTESQMAVKGLMDVCNSGGIKLETLLYVLSQAGTISTQFANNISTTKTSLDGFITSLSTMKTQQSAVSDAINAQGGTGSITLDAYKALIAQSEDYALCLEYENGSMQINADKARELWKAKTELEALDVQKQIAEETMRYADLQSRYESLTATEKEELEGVKERIDQLRILASEYQQLTSAYSMWQMVQEAPETGDMYDDMKTAVGQIKEGLDTGKIGTAKFELAVDMLIPEADKDSVDKYMDTLNRYIQDDSDGVKNFISDMISAGFMHGSDGVVASWNDAWMNEGVTIDDICEKLEITPSMAKAIFGELEEYHFDFDWTEADFDAEVLEDQIGDASNAFEKFKRDLESGLIIGGENIDVSRVDHYIAKMDELNAKIQELETYDLSIEANKNALDAAKAEVASTIQQAAAEDIIISVDGIEVDTATAQSQIQAVAADLDNIGAKLDIIAAKLLGDLGASATSTALQKVHSQLQAIEAMKINDKSFTTTNTIVTRTAGSSTPSDNSGNTSGIGGLLRGFFASGTRNAKQGMALVGEEGREIVVQKNRYFVAGENGPEFVNLNRGDMVFSNPDTERMLKTMPSSNGGQAFASGTSITSLAKNLINGLVSATKSANESINKSNSTSARQNAAKAEDIAYKNSNKTSTAIKEAALQAEEAAEIAAVKSIVASNGGKIPDYLKNVSSNSNSSGNSGGGDSSGGSSGNAESEFEKQYKYHQHLLAMDEEETSDYLAWLEKAYQEAYEKGEIELDDYRKYREEVYNGQHDLFLENLDDTEHRISMLEANDGDINTIINMYNTMIGDIEKELEKAYASGLDDNDDYVQELQDKLVDYKDEVKSTNEEIAEDTKDIYEDLIEYRIDMLKQDLENEKDALNKKLDYLQDFYSKQKDMLQDVYDEEKYLEKQSEKRKAVDDIKAELAMIDRDTSASAQKRKLELQEELIEAEKELADFEKDHALEMAQDALDKQLELQEERLNSEINIIDEKLEDQKGLREQAIEDLQNGDLALYEEMIKYNDRYGDGNDNTIKEMWEEAYISMQKYFDLFGKYYEGMKLQNVTNYSPDVSGYANGTPSATRGLHEIEEEDTEYIFQSSNGKRYKLFSGGEKVLNAGATDFLYKFANSGGKVLSDMISMAMKMPPSNLASANQINEIRMGDIIVQGNADQKTVSQIRRDQRDEVNRMLKEFGRLQNK